MLMAKFLAGFLLPSLLLEAALSNWSSISFDYLLAFLLVHYKAPEIGYRFQRARWLLWLIIIFSFTVLLPQVIYLVLWAVVGQEWNAADTGWMRVIGFMILHSWSHPTVIYFLVFQQLTLLVSLAYIYSSRFSFVQWQDTCGLSFQEFSNS